MSPDEPGALGARAPSVGVGQANAWRAARELAVLACIGAALWMIASIELQRPTCEQGAGCADARRRLTLQVLGLQVARILAVALIILQALRVFDVNVSALMASAGISLAIVGLSLKPVLDEFVYGTTLLVQRRVNLWDTVHIFTKYGKWIPEMDAAGVRVVGLSPSYFTFEYANGDRFSLNTTHINGFMSQSDAPGDAVDKDACDAKDGCGDGPGGSGGCAGGECGGKDAPPAPRAPPRAASAPASRKSGVDFAPVAHRFIGLDDMDWEHG